MDQPSFERDVVPVVVKAAKREFGGYRDRETLVNDCLSLAWEWWKRNPTAPASGLARYAIRRVRAGEHFTRSWKSIDTPANSRVLRSKPQRVPADVLDYVRVGDDPADIAALRIDWPAFVRTLRRPMRRILRAFMLGETTDVIRRRFKLSPVYVSQLRKQIYLRWLKYTA